MIRYEEEARAAMAVGHWGTPVRAVIETLSAYKTIKGVQPSGEGFVGHVQGFLFGWVNTDN